MEKITIALQNFNLQRTLDCGQMFRFAPKGAGFVVFSGGRQIEVYQNEETTFLFDGDFAYWENFFDLTRNYEEIELFLSQDPILKPEIEKNGGIRLLNQDKFECLISFIISQNNNILRIKSIIERLCARFGEKKDNYYAFPTSETLSLASAEALTECGVGFRARYIVDAVQRINSGALNLDKISLLPTADVREELIKILGVGPKVADCVLLFAYARREIYPIDVWVKRLTEKLYFNGQPQQISDLRTFAAQKFQNMSGYAQQYIFNISRS